MIRKPGIVTKAIRRSATALVLFALAVRAVVPAGMMPDLPRLAEGEFHLVICTGHGPETVDPQDLGALATLGQERTQQSPAKAPANAPDHGSDLCPFAAALSLLGPVLLVLLFALLRPAERFRPAADPWTRFRSRSRDPWTARGPPLSFCS